MLLCAFLAAFLSFVFWNVPTWYQEWQLRQAKPDLSTPGTVQEPKAEESEENAEEVLEPVEEVPSAPTQEELEAERIEAQQREKFAELLNQNSDVVGWIQIDNTAIDLPLVQTTDNEFYLHHGLDQDSDGAGIPFVDYECDMKNGRHLIIYGHHMDSRFGDLAEYYDPDYYAEHPVLQLDTLYESCVYKVVAVYAVTARTSDADYFAFNTYVDFETDAEEQSYLNEIAQRAFYTTGDFMNADEKLLSLCTCTYQMPDARLVVVARPLREGESAQADPVTINPSPLVPERWP